MTRPTAVGTWLTPDRVWRVSSSESLHRLWVAGGSTDSFRFLSGGFTGMEKGDRLGQADGIILCHELNSCLGIRGMTHQLRHDVFIQRIWLSDGFEGAIHGEGSEGEDKVVERLSSLLTVSKEIVSCLEERRRSTDDLSLDDLSLEDFVGDVVLIIVCRGRGEASEAFVTQVAA